MARVEVNERNTAPKLADGRTVDRAAWRQTRYAAIWRALRDRGYAGALALRLAWAVASMALRETGAGANEQDWALVNIRPDGAEDAGPGWHGEYNDRRSGLFRSYADIDDAAADAVQLLADGARYSPAWRALVAGGDVDDWYEAVVRAGFYPLPDDPGARAAEVAALRREIVNGVSELQRAGVHPSEERPAPVPRPGEAASSSSPAAALAALAALLLAAAAARGTAWGRRTVARVRRSLP